MDAPSRKRTRDSKESLDERTPKRVRETERVTTPSLLGSIKKQISRFGSLRFAGTARDAETQAVDQRQIQEESAQELDVAESVAPATPPIQSTTPDYGNLQFDPSKSIFSGKPSPFARRRAGFETAMVPVFEPMSADAAEAEALKYLPKKRKLMQEAAARRREIADAADAQRRSDAMAWSVFSPPSTNNHHESTQAPQESSHLAADNIDGEFTSKKRKRLPTVDGMVPGPKHGGYGVDAEYLDVDNIVEGVDESLLDERNEPSTPVAKTVKMFAGQTPRSAMKKRPDGHTDGTITKSPKNVSFQAQPLTGVKHVYASYAKSGMYTGSTFAKASAHNTFASDATASVESPDTSDETQSSINSADMISPTTKRNTAINLIESTQSPQPEVDSELRDPQDSNWRSTLGNPRPGTFCVPDFSDDDSLISDNIGDQATPTQATFTAPTHSTPSPSTTTLDSYIIEDADDDVENNWAGTFNWPARGAHILPVKEEVMNRPMMQKVRAMWSEQETQNCRKFWQPQFDHVLSTMRTIQASGREVTFE